MDPLTHTLVGANLAATRLGRWSTLAPTALVLGANIPDVDVFAYAWGEDAAMGFRRGWTHGVLAMVVLPALLAGGLVAWDRWRRRRGSAAPPARGGALLAVSALAVATHPALDWLNTYGMRWLMPFDARWSYGDSVLIIDPWLWLALGVPWMLTRRAGRWTLAGWGVVTALFVAVVGGRSTTYLPVVLAVAGVLLLALLLRPPDPVQHPRLAAAGLALAALYAGGMIGVHAAAEARIRRELAAGGVAVARLMVAPAPLDPSSWEVLVETPQAYLEGGFRWRRTPQLALAGRRLRAAQESPLWPAVRAHPALQGFLSWCRFPWLAIEEESGRRRVILLDARYAREPSRDFAALEVPGL